MAAEEQKLKRPGSQHVELAVAIGVGDLHEAHPDVGRHFHLRLETAHRVGKQDGHAVAGAICSHEIHVAVGVQVSGRQVGGFGGRGVHAAGRRK